MGFILLTLKYLKQFAMKELRAIVRLPLQPTTPHWEIPPMVVRAIFAPVCHRRTARGLPNRIQMVFGRAVLFIQLLA